MLYTRKDRTDLAREELSFFAAVNFYTKNLETMRVKTRAKAEVFILNLR